MGWASGGEIFGRVAGVVSTHVKDETAKTAIFSEMVKAFEDFDCDTLYESAGQDDVLDRVLVDAGILEDE